MRPNGIFQDQAENEIIVVNDHCYDIANNVWTELYPGIKYKRAFTEIERILLTGTFNLSNINKQKNYLMKMRRMILC